MKKFLPAHYCRLQTMKKKENEPQSEKFIKLARELECDESEENFDRKMKKILSVKPKKEEKKEDKHNG